MKDNHTKDNPTKETDDGGFMRFVSFESAATGPERMELMVVEMARTTVREMIRKDKNSGVCGAAIGASMLEMRITLHFPKKKGGES